jgi:hypothetical protein
MTIESARDEALRLIVKVCDLPVHKIMDFETGNYPLSLEQVERLIALARQRPRWVWVPQEPTKEMLLAIIKSYEDRQLYTRKLKVSAEEYAADDWRAALKAAPKPQEGE